ncbi:hypothetical protein CBR_g49242 [Chara braunii]|uniref:LysM domain-containing protein n=1 Tax=Chara braunii TaxID=69332 RepID=A0A388M4Q2_CHABU|nr:hypothetical protein CBR_g49242 [Chara braunii]|eukprot:GBG89452.1 hypothetical protein CBR_g49242 [Chara braunii]
MAMALTSAGSLHSIAPPGVIACERRYAESGARARRVRTWLLSLSGGGASTQAASSLSEPDICRAERHVCAARSGVPLNVGLGSTRPSKVGLGYTRASRKSRSRPFWLAAVRSEGDEGRRTSGGSEGRDGSNPLRFVRWFRSKLSTFFPSGEGQREAKSGDKGNYNVYYTVKNGDTLEGIADKFDVPRHFLMEVNDIEGSKKLSAGQVLWIPHVYEVKRGDTLDSIAEKFGVPKSRLREVNGIQDADSISSEDALIIPPTEVESRAGGKGREGERQGVHSGMGGSTSGTAGTTGSAGQGGGSTTGTAGRSGTSGGPGGGSTSGARVAHLQGKEELEGWVAHLQGEEEGQRRGRRGRLVRAVPQGKAEDQLHRRRGQRVGRQPAEGRGMQGKEVDRAGDPLASKAERVLYLRVGMKRVKRFVSDHETQWKCFMDAWTQTEERRTGIGVR